MRVLVFRQRHDRGCQFLDGCFFKKDAVHQYCHRHNQYGYSGGSIQNRQLRFDLLDIQIAGARGALKYCRECEIKNLSTAGVAIKNIVRFWKIKFSLLSGVVMCQHFS